MLKANIKNTICGFKEGRMKGYDVEIRDEKGNFIQGFFVTELNIDINTKSGEIIR